MLVIIGYWFHLKQGILHTCADLILSMGIGQILDKITGTGVNYYVNA